MVARVVVVGYLRSQLWMQWEGQSWYTFGSFKLQLNVSVGGVCNRSQGSSGQQVGWTGQGLCVESRFL